MIKISNSNVAEQEIRYMKKNEADVGKDQYEQLNEEPGQIQKKLSALLRG